MVSVEIGKKQYVGSVLGVDAAKLALLRRDGGVKHLQRNSITRITKFSDRFRPYTIETIKTRLKNEYGRGYSISNTEHFVVVFPSGKRKRWATQFETLYRQFRHYFEARGFQLDRPRYPLIAIVLRDRPSFERTVSKNLDSRNVVGFYAPKTNRVITYDQNLATDDRGSATANFRTIIHEATHQSAFNTGIHDRFSQSPRWVTEGLATLFEAPGVHNSIAHPGRKNRLLDDRFQHFRKMLKRDQWRGKLERLVRDDRMFDANPRDAYTLAWALTFYLVESRSHSFWDYLKAMNQSPSENRDALFAQHIDANFRRLESRMKAFYESLQP